MKKIIIAIPHSHTWFWTQTCVSSLLRNPPKAAGYECEVVIVDNSPWSPAIKGVTDTDLLRGPASNYYEIFANPKSNKFHASALDTVVEHYHFDLLMAFETDVLALHPGWLQWFVDQLRPTDYAAGHWHHEQFINPSCTLYRGDVLRWMQNWCKLDAPQDELRWGENFSLSGPLDNNLPASENPAEVLQNMKDWICGPFAEKRGWPAGTCLKETPSGQLKGPGWYEPGQMLHHWAVEQGYTYTICPTSSTYKQPGMPIATYYGPRIDADPHRQLEMAEMQADGGVAETVHLWGGTRALDILKHPVTCGFVGANTPFWLEREARFWRDTVPPEVQKQTLAMIKKYGWHLKGQGTAEVTDRDREAAAFVQRNYEAGGVVF